MIVVENLVRRFGERVVLDGVSLTVEPGERVVLRGPNGAGKTTLLRCILGTLTPDSGRVTVREHDAGTRQARRLTGVSLSQERSLYLRLSGLENLMLVARLRGASGREARRLATEIVEELQLQDVARQPALRCSTGQLQQLSFARALVCDPPALLLDEPTRSLDTEATSRMWAALARRPSAAVVMATHLESDVIRATAVFDLRPGWSGAGS